MFGWDPDPDPLFEINYGTADLDPSKGKIVILFTFCLVPCLHIYNIRNCWLPYVNICRYVYRL